MKDSYMSNWDFPSKKWIHHKMLAFSVIQVRPKSHRILFLTCLTNEAKMLLSILALSSSKLSTTMNPAGVGDGALSKLSAAMC